MPVAFGFSIGDVIAGINLLIDSVKSLDSAHGAKADYQELGRELSSLNDALDGIQALSLSQAQLAQVKAVNTAVDGCRICIDGFVQRNSKFQSLDSTPAKRWSPAAFKKGVLGIRWAIVKKKEVAKFRLDIQRHSDRILLLLATLEM